MGEVHSLHSDSAACQSQASAEWEVSFRNGQVGSLVCKRRRKVGSKMYAFHTRLSTKTFLIIKVGRCQTIRIEPLRAVRNPLISAATTCDPILNSRPPERFS